MVVAALLGTGAAGCADVDDRDELELALDEEGSPDALADAEALDALLEDGITLEDGMTLGDVIHLLPPEALPHGLTAEDLELPVVTEKGPEPAFDAVGDLRIDVAPVAIGEPACATTSIANPSHGAQIAMSPTPSPCGDVTNTSTSPNTSYGAAGCPNQYITEVTGTMGRPLSFYRDWWASGLNETTCGLAHLYHSAFGRSMLAYWNGSVWVISTSWTKLGTMGLHGEWHDGELFDICAWTLDEGSSYLPDLQENHLYNRLRIASQEVVFAIWPVKRVVEAGVTHGEACEPL